MKARPYRGVILGLVIALIIVAIVLLSNTRPEPNPPLKNTLADIQTSVPDEVRSEKSDYPRAKELVDIDGYVNVGNVTVSEFIGKKVVLVDFWTYSCINCQRTLPYLSSWWDKYKDKGLVIIGVHTPEFDFEKKIENVRKATEKYGVEYPVALDNGFGTWSAYGNRYWPRKYLIDIDGYIVYDHIGEGAYEETELKIQELLSERAERLNDSMDVNVALVEETEGAKLPSTAEIYFGYAFQRGQIGNKEGWKPEEVVNYSLPAGRNPDRFYLEGRWKNNEDDMELIGDGSVTLDWHGKSVNIVAGSSAPIVVDIFEDGKPAGSVTVRDYDLYVLASHDNWATRELKIVPQEPGIRVYTFTFG